MLPSSGRAGPCPDNQVAIVGGGLAGLAAAASLSQAGFDVVLLEAANYLGILLILIHYRAIFLEPI